MNEGTVLSKENKLNQVTNKWHTYLLKVFLYGAIVICFDVPVYSV